MIDAFDYRSHFEISGHLVFFLLPPAHTDTCNIEGGLRLAGFNSELAGYVEICKNETWLRLLTDKDQSWTHKNSIVACQQLGYLDALWLFADTTRCVTDICMILNSRLSYGSMGFLHSTFIY